MRFDLHTHTFYSDSFYSPEAVVKMAIRKGLDGIAITDHNTFSGVKRAVGFSKEKSILVIPGEEVLTDVGEVIGLFLQERISPGQFDDVVDRIRDQDAIIVFPHPCDRLRRGVLKQNQELASRADAVETFNARVIFNEDNLMAGKLAEKYGSAQTGGSDAHFDFEIGSGWTEFDGEGERGLREAIKKRNTVSGGRLSTPFVHGFGKVANLVNRFRR
ncbi:MAG: PHP domain-containing protein [Candidatus Micrarchaeota archaeon]